MESGKVVGMFICTYIYHKRILLKKIPILDVIGVVYEIGEVISIKTAKQSCKREIQIIAKWNKMVCARIINYTSN